MRTLVCRQSLLISLVFVLPGVARAGLVWESSWRVTSTDGKYLLVQISPHPVDEDARSPAEEPAVREIRSKYKQSGLYRNDGSSEPLWQIPYHVPVYDVYIAPGGDYVVIAMEDCDHGISNAGLGGVIYFYGKGHEPACYRDYQIPWCFVFKGLVNRLLARDLIQFKEAKFNPQSLTYSLKTNQSEEFVFDVRTGKIIRRWSPWPFYLGIPMLMVPIVVFSLCRRESYKAASNCKSGHLQFSVQGMLFLVTATCVFFWLASINVMFAIACSAIGFVGGTIAWLFSRSHRAWLIGSILSLYGGFMGLFCWSSLVDLRLDVDHFSVIGTLVFLLSIGVAGGGLVAGWLEKNRFQSQQPDNRC